MAKQKSADSSVSRPRKKDSKSMDTQEERLQIVREHITAAAKILANLDSEFHRVAWMLEDTLMYVDEAVENSCSGSRGKPVEIPGLDEADIVTAQS